MNNITNHNEEYLEENSFSIIDFIRKYVRYWRWFLIGGLIALVIGFLYLRYAPVLYVTTTKIKIIDESKQSDIASDVKKEMWGLSTVNLDNEMEVLKSHRLLGEVVGDLNLDISYFYVGFFKTAEIWNAPFKVKKFISSDSLTRSKTYDVKLKDDHFSISDEDGIDYNVAYTSENNSVLGLPFSIEVSDNINTKEFSDISYKFMLSPKEAIIANLIKGVQVEPASKKGDILVLWLIGESLERSEIILNKIVEEFNEDGVEDKQAISKRALDFIDERFIYLTGELDSIESGKQDFKQDNTLAYIEEDATTILKRKSEAEEESFNLQTQLSLSRLLRSAVNKEDEYGLLPPDVGLDNSSINSLVSKYNELSRERTSLKASMPENHPTMRSLNNQLRSGKENILKTLEVNQRQLSTSLARLEREKELAGEQFSRIPEKEKMLRAIERQQSIKENLFLLLLSKREEAAIKNAITAPVIKVIDYAQTAGKPVAPKKNLVYPIALVLGLLVPFAVLFISFSLNTKIQDSGDIEKLNLKTPLLAEIPFIRNYEGAQTVHERSVIAESFNILCSNIIRANDSTGGMVILVTSAIKGEGKTSTAVNLASAFSSLRNRVLLVGGDLRNPRLHDYFNIHKDSLGMSNFMLFPEMDWTDCIHKITEYPFPFHVCPSGTENFNPPELLANKNLASFMNRIKKEFDYIIIDSAPALLVSDTRLIAKYADMTLFVLRANYTEKRLLDFSKDLNRNQTLKNMGYILNAVGSDSELNNYNYGYGYGYHAETEEPENKLEIFAEKLKRVLKKILINTEKLLIRIFKKRN